MKQYFVPVSPGLFVAWALFRISPPPDGIDPRKFWLASMLGTCSILGVLAYYAYVLTPEATPYYLLAGGVMIPLPIGAAVSVTGFVVAALLVGKVNWHCFMPSDEPPPVPEPEPLFTAMENNPAVALAQQAAPVVTSPYILPEPECEAQAAAQNGPEPTTNTEGAEAVMGTEPSQTPPKGQHEAVELGSYVFADEEGTIW